MIKIVKITSVLLPPQKCGKLDPTFASATLLFQKDPPANVQLFQVRTDGVWLVSGALADHSRWCSPLANDLLELFVGCWKLLTVMHKNPGKKMGITLMSVKLFAPFYLPKFLSWHYSHLQLLLTEKNLYFYFVCSGSSLGLMCKVRSSLEHINKQTNKKQLSTEAFWEAVGKGSAFPMNVLDFVGHIASAATPQLSCCSTKTARGKHCIPIKL